MPLDGFWAPLPLTDRSGIDERFDYTALADWLQRNLRTLIVTGDIMSFNWDGAADLSSVDANATAGYFLDASVGSAQLMGDLFIGGDLTLTTGGIFMSAASEPFVKMATTSAAFIELAFASSQDDSAFIQAYGVGQLALFSPRSTSVAKRVQMDLYDNLEGVNAFVEMGGDSNGQDIAVLRLNNSHATDKKILILESQTTERHLFTGDQYQGVAGSAAAPGIVSRGDLDTGVYWTDDDILHLAAGGTELIRLTEGTTDFVTVLPDLRANYGGTDGRSVAGNTGTKVDKSFASTVANTTWTAATWDTEIRDDEGWHSTSSNTDRITIDDAGWYVCSTTLNWDGEATGDRMIVRILDSTSPVAAGTPEIEIAREEFAADTTVDMYTNLCGVQYLAAGDTVIVAVWHDGGAGVSISPTSSFTVAKLF